MDDLTDSESEGKDYPGNWNLEVSMRRARVGRVGWNPFPIPCSYQSPTVLAGHVPCWANFVADWYWVLTKSRLCVCQAVRGGLSDNQLSSVSMEART